MADRARDFWIHVNGPRAADFEKVFGTTTVAMLSPATHMAELPGLDGPQEVYLLDLDWAAEQGFWAKLIEHLADRFGDVPAGVVETELRRVGMPILAADTTLRIDHPQRWFN